MASISKIRVNEIDYPLTPDDIVTSLNIEPVSSSAHTETGGAYSNNTVESIYQKYLADSNSDVQPLKILILNYDGSKTPTDNSAAAIATTYAASLPGGKNTTKSIVTLFGSYNITGENTNCWATYSDNDNVFAFGYFRSSTQAFEWTKK